jgi:hypothetical protein
MKIFQKSVFQITCSLVTGERINQFSFLLLLLDENNLFEMMFHLVTLGVPLEE